MIGEPVLVTMGSQAPKLDFQDVRYVVTNPL